MRDPGKWPGGGGDDDLVGEALRCGDGELTLLLSIGLRDLHAKVKGVSKVAMQLQLAE